MTKITDKNLMREYAKTFSTEGGKRVMDHLRNYTIERVIGPDVSNETLRYLEGQRALVKMIERYIDQGKKGV